LSANVPATDVARVIESMRADGVASGQIGEMRVSDAPPSYDALAE